MSRSLETQRLFTADDADIADRNKKGSALPHVIRGIRVIRGLIPHSVAKSRSYR